MLGGGGGGGGELTLHCRCKNNDCIEIDSNVGHFAVSLVTGEGGEEIY